MLYINTIKNSELIHSSTRDELGVEVLNSVHTGKVLILAPHPDDDVFGCGGLISHLNANKAKIKVLYFCGGALGNKAGDRNTELVADREQEAMNGLREVGGGEANFLRADDLSLDKDGQLWEKIYEEMLLDKPDLVLLPDGNDWNSDHVAVYAATVLAYRKLRRNKPKVWSYFVWGLNTPTYLFPMDKKTENIKRSAMACHKSQLKVKRYDEAVLGMNEYLGKGLGLIHPAEGYKEIF